MQKRSIDYLFEDVVRLGCFPYAGQLKVARRARVGHYEISQLKELKRLADLVNRDFVLEVEGPDILNCKLVLICVPTICAILEHDEDAPSDFFDFG
jgi:hypothetical protein